jgi:hypothetical protein
VTKVKYLKRRIKGMANFDQHLFDLQMLQEYEYINMQEYQINMNLYFAAVKSKYWKRAHDIPGHAGPH